MYNEVIKLVKQTKTTNEYGDVQSTFTEREIFAEVQSIGQSEFYQAHGVGLKPEIKFIIADYLDYEGEEKIKYNAYNGVETVYEVIRTYRSDNRLEITCQRGID